MAQYDAIIIGGGINGLVTTGLLQKAGLSTLLLEAGGGFGGLAAQVDAEGQPQAPSLAQSGMISPSVFRSLNLSSQGLSVQPERLDQEFHHPGYDSFRLFAGDADQQQAVMSRFSPKDADRLPVFRARLTRLASALKPFLERTPPRLAEMVLADRLELLCLGVSLKRLGRADLRDFLRIIAMNEADLLEEVFESEAAQGLFAFDGVLGNLFGPRSPNTVFTLLYRWATAFDGASGSPVRPLGGAHALVSALVRQARSLGAVLRSEAEVERVLLVDDRAAAVRLTSGEEVGAPLILSSLHPGRSCLDLLGVEHLDADWVRNLQHARGRGVNAALTLSLAGLPETEGSAAGWLRRRFVFAGGIRALEAAHDSAKYGELPDDPPFEASVSTGEKPGTFRMQVTAQYCPENLKVSSWQQEGEKLQRSILRRLGEAYPGFNACVEGVRMQTPSDLAASYGLPGGHWHHLELGLDQIYLLRPLPGWGQYSTPVEGFFLCGAGCHPGGGLQGAAGANAAHRALLHHKARNKTLRAKGG
ncbi:FAD-dependent oxidoreductase [Limibacillus sp. MBR-115]|jgi:phytoene dehydrogenase-like protein|uniref:phytoene desaturase family protein n=1 Tax=Limibacillus sp. MBR-115 TaxID=3156465 RepID=UPI003391EB70